MRDDAIDVNTLFCLLNTRLLTTLRQQHLEPKLETCLCSYIPYNPSKDPVKMATKTALNVALLAATAAALKDIPALGLGTWLSDKDKVPHAVQFGLDNGYNHIDAAWIYSRSPWPVPSHAVAV